MHPAPKRQPTQGHLIFGLLESIDGGHITGWAIDRLNPHTPLPMRVTIDGKLVGLIECNAERHDLKHLNLPSQIVGFDYPVPGRFKDGLRHVLSFLTLEGEPIQLPGADSRAYSEIYFSIILQQEIDGVLDGLVDSMIHGWALKVDKETGVKTGGTRLLLSIDGQPVAELVADQFRADVAETYNVDPSCGFSYALPPECRYGRMVKLEVHAMPARIHLRHSPMEVFLPSDAERGRILGLIDRADELFRFAYHLRRDLRAALPVERYSLSDYEAWTRQNHSKIGPRAAVRYGDIAGQPLVSVLCPVYRPEVFDFLAAVDSVAAQSYKNWELILVDDGSKDVRLKEIIKSFSKTNPRIRAVFQTKNEGISSATNRALTEARGEVVVFFDHDDLLDPNALEIMLRARSATGAKLLYSDEDKVNHAGALLGAKFQAGFQLSISVGVELHLSSGDDGYCFGAPA